MQIRTCIRRVAWERGMTTIEIARRLGVYRSNLSAADAGRRPISLKALARIADLLACSPGDLVERADAGQPAVFRAARINARVAARDAALIDGTERSWVHAVTLAWQRHYARR